MTFDPNASGGGALDRRARAAHEAALHALSAQARLQLRRRTRLALDGERPTTERRPSRWGWIAAPALAIVVAFAVQDPAPQRADQAASAPVAADPAAPPDLAAPLEHDPDFYLWRASADAFALAGDP